MIHQKLRILREEKGLSQREVADALHIGQGTISNIEMGKTKVDVDLLYKFADFFEVEPYQLLGNNSLTMHFNEKVENGYINHIQTLNQDNKELIQSIREQLAEKDKQISELIQILKSK